tara:strand:+ start:2060 stop:2581 length:522 start_codon:yes stop_codon:yes gene_type:complete
MAFKTVQITPTISLAAYADGDVFFNSELYLPSRGAKLIGGYLLDYDGQLGSDKLGLLFFARNTNVLGEVNASADITKANFRINQFQGAVNIADAIAGGDLMGEIDTPPVIRPFVAYDDVDVDTDLPASLESRGPVLSSIETGGKIYVSGVLHTVSGGPDFATQAIDLVFHFEY